MEALTIASTVFSVIGQMQQANSQAANYRAQQQMSERNATIMEQNAGIERSQANQREESQRREARMILGSQRAALSQSGIGAGGSAADIMAQSASDAELDSLTLRYEGDMRARGLMVEAEGERYQGRVAGMNASAAKQAGQMAAIGTILGGAGKYMGAQADQRYRNEILRRIG